MTILNIPIRDILLIVLILIIVVPILAFLCMKMGIVGLNRGKEATKRRRIDITTVGDKKRKTEKL